MGFQHLYCDEESELVHIREQALAGEVGHCGFAVDADCESDYVKQVEYDQLERKVDGSKEQPNHVEEIGQCGSGESVAMSHLDACGDAQIQLSHI